MTAGKHSRKGTILRILAAAALVFCAIRVVILVQSLLEYQRAQEEYSELLNLIDTDAAAVQSSGEESLSAENEGMQVQEESTEEESVWYPAIRVDYDAFYSTNEEFVGVLSVPALDLMYPIAQTTDNEKYLTTTFEGSENSSGCIFLDCSASSDFSDWNTFVFGHNMKNKTMFGSLKLFLQDDELCDSDPYIYIYQEDQVLVYRIYAYFTVPTNDDIYQYIESEDEYDEYVQYSLSLSSYDLPENTVDWEDRPQILTLSTCYGTGHTTYCIVQAVLMGTAS